MHVFVINDLDICVIYMNVHWKIWLKAAANNAVLICRKESNKIYT